MARDDFSKITIDVLAKRVAFLCSNPKCKKPTIGPNSDPLKPTLIGVAAHITAASPGGPRYDASMDPSQRSSIENGIWLCNNCSTLIDKDPNLFPTDLLRGWKQTAEGESLFKITSSASNSPSQAPFLEADLIWTFGGRWNMGFSSKNATQEHEGRQVMIISGEFAPIIFWRLSWHYRITIYNNSEVAAYNVSSSPMGDIYFEEISRLPKINNLPAFQNLDLEAECSTMFEGTWLEADEILKYHIPSNLNGLKMKISYFDAERNQHFTIATIKGNELTNARGNPES